MLSELNLPDDLVRLDESELSGIAEEIRSKIVHAVEKNGGHLASNLGVVELTIALHRAFRSPQDAIVWDVSHQCYAHKILTGRLDRFDTIRLRGGISGFTKRSESGHDFFDCGHAATAISSAFGLLEARRLQGNRGKVVAVIGDGSLTSGMTWEALSHVGQVGGDLIVVLNDNQMSISRTTGAMSAYLSRLRLLPRYQSFRNRIDWLIERIPFLGKKIAKAVFAFKRMCKASFYKTNMFAELGFEYVGPIDGHDIAALDDVFQRVKNVRRPIVVHVMTQKGRGYVPAEANPAAFHGVSPFSQKDGVLEKKNGCSFSRAFSECLVAAAEKDPKIVAVTAAMKQGTGLSAFEAKFPRRFFDVGIAEEHAVTFAGALASGGMKPVVAIYSTFFQRAIDQVIHDVSLQRDSVVFALDRSGAVPDDGPTHQGIFDIALLRPIPSLKILSPASKAEMCLSLDWALSCGSPAALRYAKASCPAEIPEFSEPFAEGRGVFASKSEGASILLVCTGGIFSEVREASRLLLCAGIPNDIYNLRFIKPIDEPYFMKICAPYGCVLFAEDGVLTGGIGQYLQSLLPKSAYSTVCAFPDGFPENGSRSDILKQAGLSPDQIALQAELLVAKKAGAAQAAQKDKSERKEKCRA